MASYSAADASTTQLLTVLQGTAGCIQIRDGTDLRVVVSDYQSTDTGDTVFVFVKAPGAVLTSLAPPDLSLQCVVPAMIATQESPDVILIED